MQAVDLAFRNREAYDDFGDVHEPEDGVEHVQLHAFVGHHFGDIAVERRLERAFVERVLRRLGGRAGLAQLGVDLHHLHLRDAARAVDLACALVSVLGLAEGGLGHLPCAAHGLGLDSAENLPCAHPVASACVQRYQASGVGCGYHRGPDGLGGAHVGNDTGGAYVGDFLYLHRYRRPFSGTCPSAGGIAACENQQGSDIYRNPFHLSLSLATHFMSEPVTT